MIINRMVDTSRFLPRSAITFCIHFGDVVCIYSADRICDKYTLQDLFLWWKYILGKEIQGRNSSATTEK